MIKKQGRMLKNVSFSFLLVATCLWPHYFPSFKYICSFVYTPADPWRKQSMRWTCIYFPSSYAWLHLNTACSCLSEKKHFRSSTEIWTDSSVTSKQLGEEKKPVAPPELNKNERKSNTRSNLPTEQGTLDTWHVTHQTFNSVGKGFQDTRPLGICWKEMKSLEWEKKITSFVTLPGSRWSCLAKYFPFVNGFHPSVSYIYT